MTKLTAKKRDDVKALLEEHQQVTDALLNLGKSGFTSDVNVMKADDNDITVVPLRFDIAKKALTDQKAWIEECGSSSTGGNGQPQAEPTANNGAGPWAPRIVPSLRGDSAVSNLTPPAKR